MHAMPLTYVEVVATCHGVPVGGDVAVGHRGIVLVALAGRVARLAHVVVVGGVVGEAEAALTFLRNIDYLEC